MISWAGFSLRRSSNPVRPGPIPSLYPLSWSAPRYHLAPRYHFTPLGLAPRASVFTE